MKKHFVHFVSPGTFFSEVTSQEVAECDPDLACQLAAGITERYGARPVAFHFTTRELPEGAFDSIEISRTGTYHLGGEKLTADQIEARGDPRDSILIGNMRGNNVAAVIETHHSWKYTAEFRVGDFHIEDFRYE